LLTLKYIFNKKDISLSKN